MLCVQRKIIMFARQIFGRVNMMVESTFMEAVHQKRNFSVTCGDFLLSPTAGLAFIPTKARMLITTHLWVQYILERDRIVIPSMMVLIYYFYLVAKACSHPVSYTLLSCARPQKYCIHFGFHPIAFCRQQVCKQMCLLCASAAAWRQATPEPNPTPVRSAQTRLCANQTGLWGGCGSSPTGYHCLFVWKVQPCLFGGNISKPYIYTRTRI